MSFVTDITDELSGPLNMSQAELKRLYEAGISISDTETTGLNRDRHGLTEFASIKAVKETDAKGRTRYRLHSFSAHILPLRPEYQEYLAACAEAKRQGKSPPPYDPATYEYEIEPKALNVTGTRFVRDGVRGPIIGMEVLQADGSFQQVTARPFYEVADAMVDFITPKDLYYNAPFDKPLLASQLRDVYAYRVMEALRDGHLERAKDHGFDEEQLKELQRHPLHWEQQVRGLLRLPEKLHMENPAEYRCLMFHYLSIHGSGPSNTLDDAYRNLVDPAFTKRPEHKAVEDILMAAKVGLAMDRKLGGYPTMAELYQKILRKGDASIQVTSGPTEDWGIGAAAGDLRVDFGKPAQLLQGRAATYWHFFADMHEAKARNRRTLPHLRDLDAAQGKALLSADRKQPMILPFLRKLMVYEQMLDGKLIERLTPFDSVGNRVNVSLRGYAGQPPITIEDTHYGSLRANLKLFEEQFARAKTPSQKKAALQEITGAIQLIGQLRDGNRKVGTVVFSHDDTGQINRVTLKGHLRELGDVRFHLPHVTRLQDAAPKIRESLDDLLKLGLIPEAQRLEVNTPEEEAAEPEGVQEERAEKQPKHTEALISQDVFLHNDRHKLALTPRLFASIARRSGVDAGSTMLGTLHVTHEAQRVVLEGNNADLRRVLYHPEDNRPVASAFNTVRDVSWLLYRLSTIPGTISLELQGPMAELRQYPVISEKALEALHRAGIPFKAYRSMIRIDFDQLLHDGFFWSGRLSDALKEMKENADKPPHLRLPPKPYYADLQEALIGGLIQAVESDEERTLWALENNLQKKGEPPHHQLFIDANQRILLSGKGRQLNVFASTVEGLHRSSEEPSADGKTAVIMSPVMAELTQNIVRRHKPNKRVMATTQGHTTRIHCPDDVLPTLREGVKESAEIIRLLETCHGLARPRCKAITLEDTKLTLHLPQVHLLLPELTADLAIFANMLNQSDFDKALREAIEALPDLTQADRRRDHAGLFVAKLGKSLPILETALTALERLNGNLEKYKVKGRMAEQLGHFSTLIHELAALNDRGALGKDGTALFHQVMVARDASDKVAYGMERLEIQLLQLRTLFLGSPHVPGFHRILADSLLEDADRTILAATSREEIAQFLQNLEKRLYPLYKKSMQHRVGPPLTDAEIHAQVEEIFFSHFREKSFQFLLKCEEEPAPLSKAYESAAEVLWHFSEAHLASKQQWKRTVSQEKESREQDRNSGFTERDEPWHGLHESIDFQPPSLAEQTPRWLALRHLYSHRHGIDSAEAMVQEISQIAPDLKSNEVREWVDQFRLSAGLISQTTLIEEQQAAHEARVTSGVIEAARKVISTLLAMREEGVVLPVYQHRVEIILQELRDLSPTGELPDAIAKTMLEAQTKHYSEKAQTQASIRLQGWDKLLGETSKPEHVLYQKGIADLTYCLRHQLQAKSKHYVGKLIAHIPQKYPELVFMRDVLSKRIPNMVSAMEGLLSVKHHVASYLGDAVSMLHRDAGREYMIGEAFEHPLAAVREGEQRMRAYAGLQAMSNLKRLGFEPSMVPDGNITFDATALLKNPSQWLDEFHKRKVSPPPLAFPIQGEIASFRRWRGQIFDMVTWLEKRMPEPLVKGIMCEDSGVARLYLHPCPRHLLADRTELLKLGLSRYHLAMLEGQEFYDSEGQPAPEGLIILKPPYQEQEQPASLPVVGAHLALLGSRLEGIELSAARSSVKSGVTRSGRFRK